MNQKQQINLATAMLATMVFQNQQSPKIDKEAFEKARQELNKKLQEDAVMVGYYTNGLLDRLDNLSKHTVVWAKELKMIGNRFRDFLLKNEQRVWNHIEENKSQDDFFGVAMKMDKVFQMVVNFDNEKTIRLFQAIEMIQENNFVEVKDQKELENLKDSKELLKKVISYVESKPKITQADFLQYLRSL